MSRLADYFVLVGYDHEKDSKWAQLHKIVNIVYKIQIPLRFHRKKCVCIEFTSSSLHFWPSFTTEDYWRDTVNKTDFGIQQCSVYACCTCWNCMLVLSFKSWDMKSNKLWFVTGVLTVIFLTWAGWGFTTGHTVTPVLLAVFSTDYDTSIPPYCQSTRGPPVTSVVSVKSPLSMNT